MPTQLTAQHRELAYAPPYDRMADASLKTISSKEDAYKDRIDIDYLHKNTHTHRYNYCIHQKAAHLRDFEASLAEKIEFKIFNPAAGNEEKSKMSSGWKGMKRV